MNEIAHSLRILIADDQPIFREGLQRRLEAEREFRVVGEAADGEEAVKLGRQLKPDVLLLDVAMPRVLDLEALRELASSPTPMRTILLTAAIERKQIVEALQLGAPGVVMEESATELLLKSIRTAMAGQYWFGRESLTDLVRALRTGMPNSGLCRHLNRGSRSTDVPTGYNRHNQRPSRKARRRSGGRYRPGTTPDGLE